MTYFLLVTLVVVFAVMLVVATAVLPGMHEEYPDLYWALSFSIYVSAALLGALVYSAFASS